MCWKHGKGVGSVVASILMLSELLDILTGFGLALIRVSSTLSSSSITSEEEVEVVSSGTSGTSGLVAAFVVGDKFEHLNGLVVGR